MTAVHTPRPVVYDVGQGPECMVCGRRVYGFPGQYRHEGDVSLTEPPAPALTDVERAEAWWRSLDDMTKVRTWQGADLRPVSSGAAPVGRDHPATAKAAAARMRALRSGTWRERIVDALTASKDGLTDKELETLLGGVHETVSGQRKSLLDDGWIVDSGRTRPSPSGNLVIVWVLSEEGKRALVARVAPAR